MPTACARTRGLTPQRARPCAPPRAAGWPFVQAEKEYIASPVLVDINEDGTEEILAVTKNAELTFFT